MKSTISRILFESSATSDASVSPIKHGSVGTRSLEMSRQDMTNFALQPEPETASKDVVQKEEQQDEVDETDKLEAEAA